MIIRKMKNVLVTSQTVRKGREGLGSRSDLRTKSDILPQSGGDWGPSIVTICLRLPELNHEENNRVSCLPRLTMACMVSMRSPDLLYHGEIIKRTITDSC